MHLPVAGPASRILAYSIDAVVIILVELLVVFTLVTSSAVLQRLLEWLRPWLERLEEGDPQAVQDSGAMLAFLGLALLAQFAIELGYFLFWEAVSGGRSLGKWSLGLRVVSDDGVPLRLRQSLVRNLLRIVDLLPGSYGVGLIAMVLSDQGKRLGDLAAGTIVVRLDRPQAAMPLPAASSDVLAAFRFERSQLACLGPDEKMLLRQTLRRLDDLDPARAEAALGTAAEALCARIGYPPVAAAERRAFLMALLDAAQRS